MYPLQTLIYQSLGTTCKYRARRLLAERLGNSNRSKAFNLADHFLNNPVIGTEQSNRLHQALNVPKEVVLKAVQEGLNQKQEEHRLAYLNAMGPHLQVRTKGPITSPTYAALAHQKLKVIKLPWDVLALPLHVQLRCATTRVQRYLNEYGTTLPIFGDVLGFDYCPDSDNVYTLDSSGSFVQKASTTPGVPEFSVTFR